MYIYTFFFFCVAARWRFEPGEVTATLGDISYNAVTSFSQGDGLDSATFTANNRPPFSIFPSYTTKTTSAHALCSLASVKPPLVGVSSSVSAVCVSVVRPSVTPIDMVVPPLYAHVSL